MPLNKHKFTIKRNDTYPALIVNLIDRGCLYEKRDFSLTNVTGVTFSMINTECDYYKISHKTAKVLCVTGGTIMYQWDPEDTDEPGFYSGEFELNFFGGGKMSVPQVGGINIEILKDISIG